MSRKTEIGILVALFLVLGGVVYRNFRPDTGADSDVPADIVVQPLKVPNPALHLNQLSRIRQIAYLGNHRNIFSATPPPPPVSAAREKQAKEDAAKAAAAGPAGPPPLQVPLKFYGMAVDVKTRRKLAFFTNGDNVLIASPGQTLLGHFRVIDIGMNTVRIEDTTTGQSGTIPMTPLRNP